MSTPVDEVQRPVDGPRRRPLAKWIALGVVMLLSALVIVLATRPASDERTVASPLIGKPAPAISGEALDGRQIDLASFRGRWVVVNFFATWCLPCRQEHPEMIRFSESHQGPTSPTIIAVAYDRNDISAARTFFAQNGGTWPVLSNGSRIATDYGVRGLPESFIVNPDGLIAAHVTGGVTTAQLDRLTGGVA